MDREQIRARAEAATPGPWTHYHEDGDDDCEFYCPSIDGVTVPGHRYPTWLIDATNADFIAHARTDIPDLLAAIGRVLALHEQAADSEGVFCEHCSYEWPCETVRAVES